MRRFSMALATSLTLLPFAATADGHDSEVEALFEALALPQMIEIMRLEGLEYGEAIGQDLFQGETSADWGQVVERIYDLDHMQAKVLASLKAELSGDDVTSMITFFTAAPGTTIIELEVAAREALLDDAVEEAAKEVAALAKADETDRYALVDQFVDTNDLVETNIVGALNSNYAFYTGLMDGGAFPAELTEDQVLADVWSQEPEIRQSTTEWVYSFLMLAYEPLDAADLETYIAFSATDAGQDLNGALFVAFDGMFEQISRNLGLGSAQFMGQQEL